MSEQTDPRPLALLVTRNFPPLVGGMEKLNLFLLRSLTVSWRTTLCAPVGCSAFATEAERVIELPLRPLPAFLVLCALRAFGFALFRRPACVVAGSGLLAPVAWLAARSCGARLAVYLHGLDIVVPSRVYRLLWLAFIRRCDIVLVNSRSTEKLAQNAGVRAERIAVLHPGTELPILDATAGEKFRRERDLVNCRILLSVGRFTRRKGLAEFVERSLPRIVAARPETVLVVIGEEARDALHGASGDERQRILVKASSAGVEEHVRFLGRCSEPVLVAAYQAADCHVFPIMELPGDVEGFGMVALEAAACGLPTVAFAVGGVPDAVSEPDTGRLIASGDYQAFADAVLEVIHESGGVTRSETCLAFARNLDWDRFGERLRSELSR